MDGKPVRITSPRDAIDAGIGMVHQHFMLIPVMTVAENVVLASEPRSGPFLDLAAARKRVLAASRTSSAWRSTRTRASRRSRVGQQQRVEIIKALYRNASILILDEPTAVLTPQEATDLFRILNTLRGDMGRRSSSSPTSSARCSSWPTGSPSCAAGRRSRRSPREGATEESLARLMVGREVLLRVEKQPAPPRASRCSRCATCTCSTTASSRRCAASRWTCAPGEIVGIAGVDGNGQAELVEAITGLRRPTAGTITVSGQRRHPRRREGEPRRRRRPHPRGPPPARPRARVHAGREPGPARLPPAAGVAARASSRRGGSSRRGARAPGGVRRPRRRPADARAGALGRQPAEGRDRARALRRPAAARRGPAHARPRRRRDRVRAPPAGRGARPRPRDPPRQLRARRDPRRCPTGSW